MAKATTLTSFPPQSRRADHHDHGFAGRTEAVSLTRNGLFDILTKPIAVDALAACLQRAKLRLATQRGAGIGFDFYGESTAMRTR